MRRLLLACVCLTLATSAQALETIDPLTNNVVVVLDASGSMREKMGGAKQTRMQVAKTALQSVLKTVPSSTQVGLLVFSGRQKQRDWLYPLGYRDDARLTTAINAPTPGGKTPLGSYLRTGANRLLEQRAEQLGYGTYRLLVVTDGEASDPDLVSRYLPQVLATGIVIDVIGVDMRSAHSLATRVHSYRSAKDPASLQRALAEVFAEVGGDDGDASAGFDELAALPFETADAVIGSLSSTSNEAIPQVASAQQPAK